MKAEYRAKFSDVCDDLGWTFNHYGDEYELEKVSPAGEDFIIYVAENDFAGDLRRQADDFDEDEHVAMWVQARLSGDLNVRGSIPSVKVLVEDAAAIKAMLCELAEAIERAKEECDNE